MSQDGDALLPLMARDKKSPLWATIITTIPALAIGIGGYLLERYLFTI
ncbi:MAG: putative manganese transporter [Sarcina sp.]